MVYCEHPDRLVAVIPNTGDLNVPCVPCTECEYRRCDHAITCCNGAGTRLVIVPEDLSYTAMLAANDLLAACKRAVEYLTDDEEMLAAIAKAEGRPIDA